ncbi:MAG TPA: nucleoside recognition domain-containing protein [Alphaproteobacteria bacterium]
MTPLLREAEKVLRRSLQLYWDLMVILVPMTIGVKIATVLGAVAWIAAAFEPVMALLGLPAEASVVLAAGALIGIGGAIGALSGLGDLSLSVAQMTVASSFVLVAHALPIEQRITQKAGAGFVFTTLFRLVGGFFFAGLLHAFYRISGLGQEPVTTDLLTGTEDGWIGWAIDTAEGLFWILWIIIGIVALMAVFDRLGVTAFLSRALAPLLRYLGIGPQAGPVVIIGALLGLAYGGALIIQEARSGKLPPRDIVLSLLFLCLCHSIIEDTLLFAALGADFVAITLGRVIFAILVMLVISRLVAAMPARLFAGLFPEAAKVKST